ncbi:DUF4880 domain-containing protein [Pseudomonas huaxiensis]|uniref:DUF4880 domain-containing protein n=1 Tax=Pseudomonas huaxiensis TaxID=2213017 RepID=UPI000DA657C5|nr:DUF4880 domain-containing protein [Pseudomonas huaxiensis]
MKLFQPRDRQPLDEQVLEQALHWMVLLQSGVSSDGDRQACDDWRLQNSEHERAWQRLVGINHDLRGTTQTVPASNARSLLRTRAGSSRRTLLKGFAGFAVLAAAGVSVRERTLLPELFSDYRTGTGQRQRVQLAAGVQSQLDARTALDLQPSVAGVELALNVGRVLLNVGEGATVLIRTAEGWIRPSASSRLVIARDLPGMTGSLVQVFAGSASVEFRHGDNHVVSAGQQLSFADQRVLAQDKASAASLAWTEGLLVAERMPLGLLLAHLDRYRRGVLRCAPEVAGLQVSGSYSLDHPDASLDLLARMLPIRVERVLGLWTNVTAA